MAIETNLKNRIQLVAKADEELLNGINMYLYWDELPRTQSEKINKKTTLDWEIWCDIDKSVIHPDTTRVFVGGNLIISTNKGTDIKTDIGGVGGKSFKIAEKGYTFLITSAADEENAYITVPHDNNGNHNGIFTEINFKSASGYEFGNYGFAIFNSSTEYGYHIITDAYKTTNVPFSAEPIPLIGYLYEMGQNYYFDDDNIPISYKVIAPSGNVEKLEACISLTGAEDDVPYRQVSASTTTGEGRYTFDLTPEEWEALYPATAEDVFGKIRIYLKTTLIDGTVYWDYVDSKFKITTDYLPIIEPTVKDINPATIAATGDENVFIKHVSQAYFDTGAVARKGATIAEISVDNITQSVEGEITGTIDEVESGTFIFSMTDTRGKTREETLEKALVEYFKPTCNQKIDIAFDGKYGVATVKINGTFFNQSFGAANNTIAVFIRHTLNDGSMSDWINVNSFFAEVNTEGNSYSVNFGMSNLDYDRLYTFQSKVVDTFTTEETAEYATRSIPIFDWSKEDFNFNVPVSIRGGKVAGTYILFDDEATNEDITLNDSIANYEFIEIFYTDNNGKTFGSTKIPTAGITSTLTVTLSLIEPNYDPRSVGGAVTNITHKLNIRATTYFIQGNKINLSEQQGLLYIYENVYASSRSSNMRFDTEANYINITKVLGYK